MLAKPLVHWLNPIIKFLISGFELVFLCRRQCTFGRGSPACETNRLWISGDFPGKLYDGKRPFLSYLVPRLQNESSCRTFHMTRTTTWNLPGPSGTRDCINIVYPSHPSPSSVEANTDVIHNQRQKTLKVA